MPSVLCSLQSKVATGLSEKTSCLFINNLYSLWLNASAVEYQYILDLQIIYQFWIIGKTHMTWIISLDPSYWGPSALNCWLAGIVWGHICMSSANGVTKDNQPYWSSSLLTSSSILANDEKKAKQCSKVKIQW